MGHMPIVNMITNDVRPRKKSIDFIDLQVEDQANQNMKINLLITVMKLLKYSTIKVFLYQK